MTTTTLTTLVFILLATITSTLCICSAEPEYGPNFVPLVEGYYMDAMDHYNNNFTSGTHNIGEKLFGSGYKLKISSSDGKLRLDNPTFGVQVSMVRSSETFAPFNVLLQQDGNLCVYDNRDVAIWCTGSAGRNGRYLVFLEAHAYERMYGCYILNTDKKVIHTIQEIFYGGPPKIDTLPRA
eukprot:gene16687-19835_t